MFLKRCLLHLASCGFAAGAPVAMVGPPAMPDDEVERYTRLMDDIRDFERFSNARINDLIFAGLHSDNPKVVDLTIAAMHRESRYRDMRGQNLHEEAREELGERERDIVRVPGVRDFLIDYAKDGLARHGWKAVDPLDFYQRNVWRLVFGMLTTYFPGDHEVRRLLRESLVENPEAGDRQHAMMYFLNAGLFVDDEADALRLTLLADSDPITAGAAARGLAMSHSDEGLRAMARASTSRRDEALPEIATAMATYGAPAAPHLAPLLGPDAGVGELPPHLREPVERVAAQVGRLADADAVHMAEAPRPPVPNDADGPSSGGALEADADIMHIMRTMPVVTDGIGRKVSLSLALRLHDSFPERQVLDAVFDGLRSDDPTVVERTLFAVGVYGDLIAQRDWLGYADPARGGGLRETMDTRTRRLDKVPGLRGFLTAHAERGMNPAGCRSLGEQDGLEKPPWMLSVAALAVYFPGDAGVRDLVLEMGRCRLGPEHSAAAGRRPVPRRRRGGLARRQADALGSRRGGLGGAGALLVAHGHGAGRLGGAPGAGGRGAGGHRGGRRLPRRPRRAAPAGVAFAGEPAPSSAGRRVRARRVGHRESRHAGGARGSRRLTPRDML